MSKPLFMLSKPSELNPIQNPSEDNKYKNQESSISPITNDGYHEKILSLMKIFNNKPLNQLYYKLVPKISRNSLFTLDLSAASPSLIDSLLPKNLTKDRMIYLL